MDIQVAGKLFSNPPPENGVKSNLTQDDIYDYGVPQYSGGPNSTQRSVAGGDMYLQDSKKAMDNHDFKSFEETFSSYIVQIELWRRKHLELKKAYHDRAQTEEHMFISLEQRMRILLQEGANTNSELRVKNALNEKLRLKLNELESQLHQLLWHKEMVVNLEQRCSEIFKRMDVLSSQNVELESSFLQYKGLEITMIDYEGRIHSLETEVQIWKDKYGVLVDEKNDISEQLAQANQTIQDFNLDSLRRTALLNAQSVSVENDRLREQLNSLLEKLDENSKRSNELEAENFDLNEQLKNQQNLNALLEAENQRNQVTIQDKDLQLNDLKVNLMNLEQELNQMALLEAKFERQEDVHQILTKDGVKLRQEISNQSSTIAGLKNIEYTLLEQKRENKFQQSEIERLNELIRVKNQEIDSWRTRNGKLELQNGELKHSVKLYDKLSFDLRHAVEDFDALVGTIPPRDKKINDLTGDIQRLMNDIADLKFNEKENARLKSTLQNRDNEVKDLRSQLTALTVKNKELSGAAEEKKEALNNIEKLNGQVQRLNSQVKDLNGQINRLESAKSKLEVQLSQNVIVEREAASLRLKVEQLQREIEAQVSKTSTALSDLQLQRKAANDADSKVTFTTKEISKLNELHEVTKRQLSDARGKITQLDLDLKDSNVNNITLTAKVDSLTGTNEKLQMRNHDQEKELENLTLRVRFLENQVIEAKRVAESDKLVLREENIKSNSLVKKFSKQASEWKEKYLQTEQQLTDLQQVEQRLKDQLKKNGDLEKEVTKLSDQLAQAKTQLDRHLNKVTVLSNTILDLNHAVEDLAKAKSQVSVKTHENFQLATQIPKLQQEIDNLKEQLPAQLNKISLLEVELQRVNQHYQNKVKDNEDLRNKNNALQQQVQELQQFERRLPEVEALLKATRDEANKFSTLHSDQLEQNELLRQTLSEAEVDVQTLVLLQSSHNKLQKVYLSLQDELASVKASFNRVNEQLDKTTEAKNDLELALQANNLKLDALKIRVAKLDHHISDQQTALAEKDKLLRNFKEVQEKLTQLQKLTGAQQGELEEIRRDRLRYQINEQKLQIQIEQLQNRLSFLEPLQQQVVDLNAQLTKDQSTFSDWRSKFTDLTEAKTREGDTWADKVSHLQIEINENQDKANQLTELQHLYDELESKYRTLVSTNQDTVDQLAQAHATITRLELRAAGVELLERENKTLREKFNKAEFTIQDLKAKLSKLTADYEEQRNSREYLENKAAMMAAEVERLNHKMGRKDDELENNKLIIDRLEDELSELRPHDGLIRRYEEDICKLRDEADAWMNQTKIQEDRANEALKLKDGLENTLALLSSEIERLRIKVDNRSNEIEIQKGQIQSLQEELVASQAREGANGNADGVINELKYQLDAANDQLQAKVQQVNDLTQKAQALEVELQKANIAQLRFQESQSVLRTKEHEAESFLKKIQNLQEELEQTERARVESENKVSQYAGELDRVTKKQQYQQSENQVLQDRINQYSQELDRVGKFNQVLAGENNEIRAELNVRTAQKNTPEVNPNRRVSSVLKTQLSK